MLTILIPSFDRASQLCCLLDSLREFIGKEKYDVKVLYKYSNDNYLDGYRKVADLHPSAEFLLEEDFCLDWKYLLGESTDYVMLCTDDTVFFKPISGNFLNCFDDPEVHCFSSRLGFNTICQDYTTGSLQPALAQYGYQQKADLIRWKFKRFHPQTNYGYPFSLDATTYRKADLIKYTEGLNFENPRALEHQLSTRINRSDLPDYMVCEAGSSAFCNTINCVQANGPTSGTKFSYSPKELNDKFLNGEKISLKSFKSLAGNIMSCHEEVTLVFERY